MIFEGSNGCLFASIYSLTPAGALSMSLRNLLIGLNLPECPEKEQIPKLSDYTLSPEKIM